MAHPPRRLRRSIKWHTDLIACGDGDELAVSFKCCDTIILYSKRGLSHATPLHGCYHIGCILSQL